MEIVYIVPVELLDTISTKYTNRITFKTSYNTAQSMYIIFIKLNGLEEINEFESNFDFIDKYELYDYTDKSSIVKYLLDKRLEDLIYEC